MLKVRTVLKNKGVILIYFFPFLGAVVCLYLQSFNFVCCYACFFYNSYFLLLIFQLCFLFLFIFPSYRRRSIQQASCFYLEGFNFVCCYTCCFLNNSYFFLLIFITLFLVSFYFSGLSTKKHHVGKFFSLLLLCMFVLVLFVSICNVLILFVVMHVFFLIIVIFSC